MSEFDQPDEEALDRAITAAHLLDTTVHLCARVCELAAGTGALDEFDQHADFVALCLARPSLTRHMARDFMAVAAANARRRVGAGMDLDADEFQTALRLVGTFERQVLTRMPLAVC